MQNNQSEIWNEIYTSGQQINRAPFDEVVAFVYRNQPVDVPNNMIKIMEVGCGAGNNLKHFAKEGYCCYGVEASPKAVEIANFGMERLGDYNVVRGDFRTLPWGADMFDLVIDRAALCYGDHADVTRAIEEINRVLVQKGRFLFTPFRINTNKRSGEIRCDTLRDVCRMLPDDVWNVLDFEHVDVLSYDNAVKTSHFRIVAEKR